MAALKILEDDPDGREDLAQFAAALGACREGRVRELLDGLETLVAGLTLVFVGRHCVTPVLPVDLSSLLAPVLGSAA